MNAKAAARSPWIVSGPFDALFFVGTPLLCLAAFLPLGAVFSTLDVYVAVMAFSSVGHHLPGFLRAYGDRELFRRYKARFLLAPPLAFVVFLWFGMTNQKGMLLVLMLWSIWHVSMQHYGFLRIYDAKVGSHESRTARLDWLVTVLGFASIVLLSPEYTHNLLATLYESGAPLVPLRALEVLRYAVWGAALVAGLCYIAHAVRSLLGAKPFSRVKLALNALTLVFLYVVWVGIGDIYLGLATWEVFHDVQYFAITWIYNRRLVEKGLGDTSLMRFLFRRRTSMAWLYTGAIALYGGAAWVFTTQTSAGLHTVLMAFIFTSTLLHYYFDGFIWKVRQPRTREGLDLARAEELARTDAPSRPRVGALRPLLHGLLFAMPIASVAALAALGPRHEPIAMRSAILAAAPLAPDGHMNLGLAYSEAGKPSEALASYERALELRPDHAETQGGYAVALLERFGSERAEEARSHLEQAIELDGRDPKHRVNLAVLELQRGRIEEAIAAYRAAREGGEITYQGADQHLLEGLMRLSDGELAPSIEQLHTALELRPGDLDALKALSIATQRAGRVEDYESSLRAILEVAPDDYGTRVQLAHLLLLQGRQEHAVPMLREMVASEPQDYDRKLWLAEILSTHPDAALRNGREAFELASEVVEATKSANAGALDILGAACAEIGDFPSALANAEKALALAETQNLRQSATAISTRIELYRAQSPYRAAPASSATTTVSKAAAKEQ